MFDELVSLERIRHFLPAQSSLKDFIHHNTLHAFQDEKFHQACHRASQIFGYSTYLSLEEFRESFKAGKIKENTLHRIIQDYCSKEGVLYNYQTLRYKLLAKKYSSPIQSRIGILRSKWKEHYNFNPNKVIHPTFFRILAAFLDQGIALDIFPFKEHSFLDAIRKIESESFVSLFEGQLAKDWLFDENLSIKSLLKIIVGREDYFEQYLFDQQFSHAGWSGFVSVLENNPATLLHHRSISLNEIIIFELLLELDALDQKFNGQIPKLGYSFDEELPQIFDKPDNYEIFLVLSLWQEALEWSYFDLILDGIQKSVHLPNSRIPQFQALLCIDDRSYSLRRNLEDINPEIETFGTPGFFGIEFYFKPFGSKYFTKSCPAPVQPAFLIKELDGKQRKVKDIHFGKHSHSLVSGWIFGFLSIFKLIGAIFKPKLTQFTVHSATYFDSTSILSIESQGQSEDGLKIGFTPEEMAIRVEQVLKSIGLTNSFSNLVYVIGHGGTSVNNTYYAGYDCGACSGRPGSVNAQVFSYMANHVVVRDLLKSRGLEIPDSTIFVGGLHDTTRDEIIFFTSPLKKDYLNLHEKNQSDFKKALFLNSKERALKFENVNSNLSELQVFESIKERSVSLFEPRPEWNHTLNALCIVGRKSLFKDIYLDKRPFLNSYDYSKDPEGVYLKSILGAAIPVCGGINLEYYFSRVDQQKLGSGTKLPHNVVGLFGVTNGVEDDLRPGLPSQMVEIHDPLRILFVIEHYPDVVQNVILSHSVISEWVNNEWVLMVVKNPDTGQIFRFNSGQFNIYHPII